MRVDLEAVNTSLDTRTKSLLETTVGTRKDLREELGLVTKVKTRRRRP
jgi:hypothetical protein